MARRIGLLPGTFDPVHLGHVALAQAARGAGVLDEVWFLVDAEPAYKVNVLSFEQRFEMMRRALDGFEGLRVDAVPEEVLRLPHTVAGFTELMGWYPETDFAFIVGIDMIGQLDSWPGYEQAVGEAAFLVARRPGVSEGVVDELRGRLGELGGRLDVKLFGFDEHRAASSTVARGEVSTGIAPASLDPRVYQYILEQGLYR